MQKMIEVSDYEIERGKPMPSYTHSTLEVNLIYLLVAGYKSKFDVKAELAFEINFERFTPDICLLPKQKTDYQNDIIRYTKAPIKVIEILSPTHILGDLIIKMHKFIDAGTQSYWIIIPPTKTVYIFDSNKSQSTFLEGKITDKSTGVEIEMDLLFE